MNSSEWFDRADICIQVKHEGGKGSCTGDFVKVKTGERTKEKYMNLGKGPPRGYFT